MLNIIVCIKQVLDPEAPASTYKIDETSRRMVQKGVPPVMSPFDENALEAALRIKGAQPAKITVLSAGVNLSRPILRKALAAGADDLILVEDAALDRADSFVSAAVLSAAIRKIGAYDLILAGRQAADSNSGVVGLGVAELLSIPSLTTAGKVEITGRKVMVESITASGADRVESELPALVTVSNELGGLRPLTLKEIMSAQKKAITSWNCSQLAPDLAGLGRTRMLSLSIPAFQRQCEMLKGDTPEETGERLAIKLREAKII